MLKLLPCSQATLPLLCDFSSFSSEEPGELTGVPEEYAEGVAHATVVSLRETQQEGGVAAGGNPSAVSERIDAGYFSTLHPTPFTLHPNTLNPNPTP